MSQTTASLCALQRSFVASILPLVKYRARLWYRSNRSQQEEFQADAIGVAWKYAVRLAERGRDPVALARGIAAFACRHAWEGRRVEGRNRANAVCVYRAQRLGKIGRDCELGTVLQDALADNTQSPVPDQAAFRIDFPRWLANLSERNRGIVEQLVSGEKLGDIARRFGITRSEVTRRRYTYHHLWQRFHGEGGNHAG